MPRVPRKGLERGPLHKSLLDALDAALEAADPRKAVRERLARTESGVLVRGAGVYKVNEVHVVGFGKASALMARGVLDAIPDLVAGGVVIVPRGQSVPELGPIEVLQADHPLPSRATVEASVRLLEYVESVPRDSLTLVLVSGGGSALFEVPVEGVRIEDVAEVTRRLMLRGASIEELNAVRKHLSAVKGGQLLKHVRSEHVVTLVVSDVVGDRLDTIASGPTVPDETTFRDAYAVLRAYGVWDDAPASVKAWIERGLRGEAPETPKPGDPIFRRNRVVIVANNLSALQAAASALRDRGYNVLILTDRLRGEAREVAKALAAVVESVAHNSMPVRPPAALLAGGETTVTVRGAGRGGRNQELCLALALSLGPRPPFHYAAACMGTDGIDGNSPAAGAVVDDRTLEEAQRLGLDPREYLEDNNSYAFFERLGRAIVTGYTGTNVNDVFIALVQPPRA